MSNSNKKNSIDKLNKLDQLILKLDYLENKVISAPTNLNKYIQKFITNNKYILIAISALILASIGYSTYNLIKSADTSTVKIRKTIDDIYKIIESDDSILNDSQKFIKYFYLHSIQVPSSEFDKQKLLEFYNKNTNFILNDISNKTKPIIINDLLPNILNESKNSLLSSTSQKINESVSNTLNNISSYLGSFFVSDIYAKYSNKDLLYKCYESIRENPDLSFEDFIKNFNLQDQIFKDKLDNCYNDVSYYLNKYTNQDKVKECIPIGYTNIYKNDLLHFLVYNVNNMSLFENCYNNS